MNQVQKTRFNLWQKLGFGEPAVPMAVPGELAASLTGIHIITSQTYLSFKDRLKILLSGVVMMRTALKTEKLIEGRSIAVARMGVLPPGTKPPGASVKP